MRTRPGQTGPESEQFERLSGRLQLGLEQMQLELEEDQHHQLLQYVFLLLKWNRVYNLTAVRDPVDMISRHLLDSLTVLPYVSGDGLLDIGSGAGLPGIPIAIARPRLDCTLLDSNSKKTRFIQQVVAELSLDNVSVVHARVEEVDLPPVDALVSRAFSSPLDIIELASHLCTTDGVMLFMLGHTGSLLEDLSDGWKLTRLASVSVPFEAGTRNIAVCRRRAGVCG